MSSIEADSDAGGRLRRNQGGARLAARPVHASRSAPRPGRERGAPARRSLPASIASPAWPCGRWPSPTGAGQSEQTEPDESSSRSLVYAGRVGLIVREGGGGGGAADAIGSPSPIRGIRVMMITGDHPKRPTIAADLGITASTTAPVTVSRSGARRRRPSRPASGDQVYARVAPSTSCDRRGAQADGHVVR